MEPIRLLLLDERLRSLEILSTLLTADARFKLVSRCAQEDEALAALKQLKVDIVLVDVSVTPDYGGHFISSARRSGFGGGVWVFTDGFALVQSPKLGVRAISLRERLPNELANRMWSISQIPEVSRLTALVSHRCTDRAFREPVTRDEALILMGICEGLSNRAIASRLGLSKNSARGAIQKIFIKAGVRKRRQLLEGS
jgi:DNA-binding NarL/FixJ family response regulator